MDNSSYTGTALRSFGLISLVVLGVLGTLASGGGGGGGGGGTGNTAGTIQFLAATFDVAEGSVINLRVARSGGSLGAASVDYATADGNATAGSDYAAANGTFTWVDGLSGNQTISIPITDDNMAETTESFTVTLTNVSGAALGGNASATINIIDNDVTVLSAFGPITALNSATVNGIRYDTSSTVVNINGSAANVSDLELGELVAVEGEANLSEGTGSADAIDYSASIIGPVEHIDAILDQLIVLGQTVLNNAETVFDPTIDPDTFAGLTVGETVQISGYLNAAGDVIATRIEPDSTSTGVQLIGTVAGVDLANLLFSIGRLTVDYGSATLIDLPGGAPADGLVVLIRGDLTDGILVVDEIASVEDFLAAPGERVHLAGIVTRFVSASDFDLNGFPMTTDAATYFVGGVIGDLGADAELTVDGTVAPAGDSVLANEVTFGRPVSNRTTLTFDFVNFTNISVFGLSRVTVVQGPDFSVEATGNVDIINDIQVSQNGDTVTIGNDKTQMLDAVVTMPVLNRVDVAVGALANVLLEDFIQPQMTVNVAGVSVLRGQGLVITGLTSTVSGVSLLDFSDIQGIANADIDISGVSQAILNMAAGSTLGGSVSTGQGTGTSALYYFGTNVTVNVTTDPVSSVIRLGDTRP